MTSAHKIRTNCANAKLSTGPKTALGKSRAAQNAHRHGLSLSLLAGPIRTAEIEDLAHEIAGEGAVPEILELACRIAEAQIDLIRIRGARHDLLASNINHPEQTTCDTVTQNEDLDNLIERCIGVLANQFILMDRYERRALSRRKFAIRVLDAVRRQTAA